MKPSSARIAARRGNALKLVFAARNRMSAVAAAKAGTNSELAPKTDEATRATTEEPPGWVGQDVVGARHDGDPDEQDPQQDRT